MIRVNGIGTEWHDDDIVAASQVGPAAIVVPKVDSADDVARLAKVTDPELVSLCLDTGHLHFAGGNPLEFMAVLTSQQLSQNLPTFAGAATFVIQLGAGIGRIRRVKRRQSEHFFLPVGVSFGVGPSVEMQIDGGYQWLAPNAEDARVVETFDYLRELVAEGLGVPAEAHENRPPFIALLYCEKT